MPVAVIVVFVAFLSLGPATRAAPAARFTPEPSACPITPFAATEPDYEYTETWYGGDGLWAGLDRNYAGRWYASAGGDDRLKVMWWREVRGSLVVEGRRLDAEAPPLDAWVPDYGETGYQLGALAFPTEGCWEVVGRVGETEIRFVVLVHSAEQDPGPRAEPGPAGEDVWAGIRRPLPPAPEDESLAADCAPERPADLPVYSAGAALDGTLHGRLAKGWWAIAPEYDGPVLIRGRRIDGEGELRFPYDGSLTELRLDGPGGGKDPAVPNPDGSDDPNWRYFSLQTTVPAAGCYAVQIDGWNFSALLVMPARG